MRGIFALAIGIELLAFTVGNAQSPGLSQNEIGTLRTRISQCWYPPPGINASSPDYVVLRVSLKPDGSLADRPALVESNSPRFGPALVESATQALLRCQPFTMLKPEHYAKWKDLELKFDPHELLSNSPGGAAPTRIAQESPPAAPIDDQLTVALANCDQQAAEQNAYATASKAISPTALLSPPLLLNQLAAKKQWEDDQPRRLAAIEQQRQTCRENADAASVQRRAVAQQFKTEQEKGYKRINFEDFKLDGKQLAAAEAKIAMTGFYLKVGESEYLFPSPLSIATMRETLNLDAGIGLLTDDAPRNIRKFFLDCQNNPAAAQLGCPLNILGHASICTRTNMFGSAELPCLIVDDGW